MSAKPKPNEKAEKPAAQPKLVAIQFLQRDAPWNRGDIHSFAPPHVAARLVESGVACDPADFEELSKERRG